MIVGIGTDLVAVTRLRRLYERHGESALDKLLAASERAEFDTAPDAGRFLAKRFAAKEALAKALGTGLRSPVTLTNIAICHDRFGKPSFCLAGELEALLQARSLVAHLSISDERDHAVAFVVLEQRT